MLSLGVAAERIIYANPCKQVSYLKYACSNNVALMTFDSAHELHKILGHFPAAQLVLRLRSDDPKADHQLGTKFGCSVAEGCRLLEEARELGLDVVGVRLVMVCAIGTMPVGIGSVPVGIGTVLVGIGTVPVGIGTVHVGIGTVPVGIGTVPVGIGTVPVGIGTVPVGIGTVPVGIGTVPVGIGTVPVGIGTVPVGIGTVPVGIGTVPVGIGTVPVGIGTVSCIFHCTITPTPPAPTKKRWPVFIQVYLRNH